MKNKKCKHGLVICSECVRITDAARRMSDIVNAMITFHGPFEIASKFMSFRLTDGTSDGALYDTKREAVRHVSNEKYFAFFCFRSAMGGMSPKDAQIFLDVHRHAYDNGGHLADPDDMRGGRDMIVSTRGYDTMTPYPTELWTP